MARISIDINFLLIFNILASSRDWGWSTIFINFSCICIIHRTIKWLCSFIIAIFNSNMTHLYISCLTLEWLILFDFFFAIVCFFFVGLEVLLSRSLLIIFLSTNSALPNFYALTTLFLVDAVCHYKNYNQYNKNNQRYQPGGSITLLLINLNFTPISIFLSINFKSFSELFTGFLVLGQVDKLNFTNSNCILILFFSYKSNNLSLFVTKIITWLNNKFASWTKFAIFIFVIRYIAWSSIKMNEFQASQCLGHRIKVNFHIINWWHRSEISSLSSNITVIKAIYIILRISLANIAHLKRCTGHKGTTILEIIIHVAILVFNIAYMLVIIPLSDGW